MVRDAAEQARDAPLGDLRCPAAAPAGPGGEGSGGSGGCSGRGGASGSAGFGFGTHYLPHEADHKRIGKDADHNQSIREMLEELLPGQRFRVVPRVTQLMAGIQATRRQFASCMFDESGCQQGIKRLAGYRKRWDRARGCWSDDHEHNDDSHGADAFRQFGQVADRGDTFVVATVAEASRPSRRASNWRF
jgi:hypothetical protein